MTNTNEKIRILNMVQEGKLGAQEAAQLLEALDFNPEEKSTEAIVIPGDEKYSGGKARWLRISVTDIPTGKHKVNMRIPFGVVRWGMKMAGKINFDNNTLDNLDMQNLLSDDMVNAGERGVLVDVEDKESGEHVLISLE